MSICFFISLSGFIATIPLYFLSLEHQKLEEKYGKEKAEKVGTVFGVVSGWGFFLFWIGLWLSSQARFAVPLFQEFSFRLSFLNLMVSLVQLVIFAPFFLLGAWFGIMGVIQVTLKVSETHRPTRVVTTGVYSIVRHPQYFGGLLAHVGVSFLLSALYSLLATPLIVIVVYAISRKEEAELTKEFGIKYLDYKKKVPMLFPIKRR